MTASPPVTNGSTRPRVQFADWRIPPVPAEEQRNPQPEPEAAVESTQHDLVAAAEAAGIRARSEAEAEAIRTAAAADAKAIEIKAEEDARKQRLANDRAERKAAEEQAASEARIAESNLKRDEANRAREKAARDAEEHQQAKQQQESEVAKADQRWRKYALGFYTVCAIVALPVQVAAFYDPRALWLMAAPLMLEGGAWVVLKGAAAAVANRRPHWHYRLIAWLLAFIAAGINLRHGLNAFDPATAIGTAFASVAGPGVWDLHEHGRIRKRDGDPARRERKATEKAAKAEAARKAAEEAQRVAEKEAAAKAAAEAAQKLAEARAREFPEVWKHAERLAAALGETTVTEAIWKRAHHDIEGTDPGSSVEVITGRRKAEKRVEAALTGTPVSTLSKTSNAQRAIQTPRSTYKPVPPRRAKGDTPRYSPAAGRAHGELLRRKQAVQNTSPNAN